MEKEKFALFSRQMCHPFQGGKAETQCVHFSWQTLPESSISFKNMRRTKQKMAKKSKCTFKKIIELEHNSIGLYNYFSDFARKSEFFYIINFVLSGFNMCDILQHTKKMMPFENKNTQVSCEKN